MRPGIGDNSIKRPTKLFRFLSIKIFDANFLKLIHSLRNDLVCNNQQNFQLLNKFTLCHRAKIIFYSQNLIFSLFPANHSQFTLKKKYFIWEEKIWIYWEES